MTKRESCRVKSFCTVRGVGVGWGVGGGRGDAHRSNAISTVNYILLFLLIFCKPPSVFTCMSLSEKRVDQENKLLQSHSHVL